MLYLKIVLLPLAAWRGYRLVALDTGPKYVLRKFRMWAGVKYTKEWSEWETKDGSLAEMLTCSKCAPIWWGMILTLLLLLAPDWLYLLIVLPLNAGAFTMAFENLFYAPRERLAQLQEKRIKHKLALLEEIDSLMVDHEKGS